MHSNEGHGAAAAPGLKNRRPLFLAAAATSLLLAFGTPLFTSQAQETPGSAEWQALGEATYANCAACHQATGAGIPGAFPPLAGHAAELAALPGGTDYLMHTVLFGLTGEITVDGATYNGMMPAWGQLSDAEIAAVVDYIVTAWPEAGEAGAGFEPLTADDVAAARATPLTADEVHELREKVVSQ
jgi:mono/diheme cytochrome c family protein